MFIRSKWLWKTTLLRILAGLEEATTGSIAVNGKDITALPRKEEFRNGISIICIISEFNST